MNIISAYEHSLDKIMDAIREEYNNLNQNQNEISDYLKGLLFAHKVMIEEFKKEQSRGLQSMIDREQQIKTILFRLEQLIITADKDKTEQMIQWGEDSIEYAEAEGYEAATFQAYAIVKKILEGDLNE